MVQVFKQAVAMRDRYGLHAFLTAVENAGLRQKIEAEVGSCAHFTEEEKNQLLEVLLTGKLPEGQPSASGIPATGMVSGP
jgi:hypothetical protein